MGRKSRMKRERRKAKENLNKHQEEMIEVTLQGFQVKKVAPTRFARAEVEMLDRSSEFLVKLFETEGEEGVRKYYKEFGPPLEAVNSRGDIVPLGWAIVKGEITFFMTRFMVSDGNGGFMCRDCHRGYFECICSAENDPPSVVAGYPRIPLVGELSDPGDSCHPLEALSEEA
jgi:hypothetical protein